MRLTCFHGSTTNPILQNVLVNVLCPFECCVVFNFLPSLAIQAILLIAEQEVSIG